MSVAEAAAGGVLEELPPGAEPYDAELATALVDAWESREPAYRPRTRHLLDQATPRFVNRLFLESSPYLRQHAHNPVDWHPWGEEAFEKARRLGRPVLLSVGYSTCHWCHVMEEESFEDLEIARYLNEHYLPIKLDREERPDVDAVYMTAVQLFTGSGGWPMTVWLDHQRRPFFAGTYFPARDRDRAVPVGFMTLLRRLDEAWREDPKVASSAASAAEAIRSVLEPGSAVTELPGARLVDRAVEHYASRFDHRFGGLGRAPKFPSSLPARLLLRHDRSQGDAQAQQMALYSLERMACGGMYDQVGGGFHRYSTDAAWLVPHFEKMLYDNALLMLDYLEAWQASGRQDMAWVVHDIARYLQRDMSSPQGALYTATDADSLDAHGEREEGLFFTWTPAELAAELDEQSLQAVMAAYSVSPGGNFEGRSILHRPRAYPVVAEELGIDAVQLEARVEAARDVLYQARSPRPAPLRDEKILAGWNGLAIAALARSGRLLQPGRTGEGSYTWRAARAASFVLDHMRRSGRLLRVHKDGQARLDATLEDHAFLAWGLLELYQASGDLRWLHEALALDAVLAEHFEDIDAGGFFRSADDAEALLAREKPYQDGAIPSGNSVHAANLLRLAALTGDDRYRARVDSLLTGLGVPLNQSPFALSELLLAVQRRHAGSAELVLVAPSERADLQPFLRAIAAVYLPGHVVVTAVEGADLERQERAVPLLKGKLAMGGQPTAYLCFGGSCQEPTTDPARFVELLEQAAERAHSATTTRPG